MKDKSILVINTPKNCDVCDICHKLTKDEGFCTKLRAPIFFVNGEPLKNCPLKPMPQYKEVGVGTNVFERNEAFKRAGFNECLKEILGEEEKC